LRLPAGALTGPPVEPAGAPPEGLDVGRDCIAPDAPRTFFRLITRVEGSLATKRRACLRCIDPPRLPLCEALTLPLDCAPVSDVAACASWSCFVTVPADAGTARLKIAAAKPSANVLIGLPPNKRAPVDNP
jgi:hypothetical protein